MIRTRALLWLAWTVLFGSTWKGIAAQTSPSDTEFFEKRVRPLLSTHCYSCHSAASKPLLGGLRLDSRAGMLKGGARGASLTPGQPENSLLLKAVRYDDKNLQMPPKGRLSAEQIGVLTDWVKRGAFWPAASKLPSPSSSGSAFNLKERARYWAWQPIQHATPPPVKQEAWVRNPLDAFVLAKLEAKGLKPAPTADRRTLIRRVTFDLTGLPPTPAEIDAFLADKSLNAYEKVVDRLLASPHYGERWARHWLDLVRYAETDGHEWDIEKVGAWQYRDYVIRALNADVPYNQFVMEHLAGDLLPRPRLNPIEQYNESVLGTGFYWLGSGRHSPVDLRDNEADRIDNQIDVLSKTFLGMGVGCARCHDHKFDAITTKDYYALYGFLKSTRQQEAAVGPPLPDPLRRNLQTLNKTMQQTLLQDVCSGLTQAMDISRLEWAARLQEARGNPNAILHPWFILSDGNATRSAEDFIKAREELVKRLGEQSARAKRESQDIAWLEGLGAKGTFQRWSATGEAFASWPVSSLTVRLEDGKETHNRLLLPAGTANSSGLSDKLVGTLRSPTFTIEKPRLLYHLAGKNARVRLVIEGYQRKPVEILYSSLALDVDSPDKMTWLSQDVSSWIGHRAYIELMDRGSGFIAADKIGLAENGPPSEAPNPLILQMLDDPDLTTLEALKRKFNALFKQTAEMAIAGRLAVAPDAAARYDLLRWALQTTSLPQKDAEYLAGLLEQRKTLENQIAAPFPALAATDGTGENEKVHIRGNYRTPGAEAPRRFLEVCDQDRSLDTEPGSGRLQLAQRMVAPTDPLLARVIVNRLWQHHFGEGIVRTPDDFGVMGERPTHPELLDWLASVFTEEDRQHHPPAARDTEARREEKKENRREEANPDSPRIGGRGANSPIENSYACGWSLKKLHRLMVLSSTYQMESQALKQVEIIDPQNRLLHRMPIRRLEAECIRDGMLAVSGRLDPKLCGPPVMPYLNDFTPGRGAPPSGPLDGAGRRSIYLSARRNFPIPLFLAFDYPVPVTTMGRRTVSSVPAQALALLNNPFVIEQAQVWAKRVLSEPGTSEQRIDRLYETAYGRLPRRAERDAALQFLTQQSREYGAAEDVRAWTDLCHVLFNVKEFIFIH